jgi:hypothetical protein
MTGDLNSLTRLQASQKKGLRTMLNKPRPPIVNQNAPRQRTSASSPKADDCPYCDGIDPEQPDDREHTERGQLCLGCGRVERERRP